MPIGMEPDPVEDLEREIERAIAAAARVQFGGQGDIVAAFATVQRLSQQRLDFIRPALRAVA